LEARGHFVCLFLNIFFKYKFIDFKI
jgi:hypothetical protein